MPVEITKLKSGQVSVRTPGGIKSKSTSLKKAKSQEKLLNAVEHGFVPRKQKAVKGFKAFQKGFREVTGGLGIRRKE